MAIFYLCPDEVRPVGGIRVIYRHVDILNKNGIQAYVLHGTIHFRCSWFVNKTSIAYGGQQILPRYDENLFRKPILRLKVRLDNNKTRLLRHDDILVFPEIYGEQVNTFQSPAQKVILNQSGFFTFWNHQLQHGKESTPYLSPDLLGIITTSSWSKKYLNFAFPKLTHFNVPLSIDTSQYKFQDKKKRQICYFPRKKNEDAKQVLHLLTMRNSLQDFKIIPIENMSDRQVIEKLRESAIFLSFSDNEGFGLPAAEAMACGCIVIGYHGMGGTEFLKSRFSYPIETGNIIEYASRLEQVITQIMTSPLELQEKAKAGAIFIKNNYSLHQEEEKLVSTWNALLARRQ